MSAVSELITLGIGTPSSISYLVLTGLGTADANAGRGYRELMLIGPSTTLTAGVIYALPARRVLVRVQQTGGTIECSNDGVTFAAITLDDDEQFEAAGGFIKAVSADAILIAKC